MNNEITLHTIAIYDDKEYELQDLLNNLLNELQRKDNITNKAINHIMNIFRDENWYENYDYDDLVSSLKDTLGILRGL